MVDRPPPDITPEAFFETWLPAQYRRVAADLDNAPPDLVARVELDGDGGGTWRLHLQGGELTVTRGAGEALIGLKQTVDDWRAVTTGTLGGDGGDIELPDAMTLDRLLLHPALGRIHSALQSVTGTLDFEVPGLPGGTFRIRVVFQDGAEPHAKVSVAADVLAGIRAGTLNPMQAFMAGQIQMSGDTALAMQLGMLMMAQGGGQGGR